MGLPLRAFHQRVVLASIVVHAATAWFSTGWYGDDEHYQVIAFAQQRMGELPAHELAWEFDARIRSAFLPSIAYGMVHLCRTIAIADPFVITFGLRLITALCALLVVHFFVRSVLPQVSGPLQRPYVLLAYFLWFLPYQHVRFAADSWGGLLLLAGITALLNDGRNKRAGLFAGILFGLAVQVKPAVGVACVGMVLWWLANGDRRAARAAQLVLGLLAALIGGGLLDAWFYGRPSPVLLNYLHMAITGSGPLPLGTYPWFYYVPWIIKYAIWPIGALILVALLLLTWRSPRSWPVWTVWPYLLVLSLVPHKEVRFLFPLVDLVPVVLVLAWQALPEGRAKRTLASHAVLVPLVVINLCALLVAGITAAGTGRTRLAGALRHEHVPGPTTIGYALDEVGIWKIRIPSFYLPTNMTDIGSWRSGSDNTAPTFLIAPLPDPRMSNPAATAPAGYKRIASTGPSWVEPLFWLYNPDRPPPYLLYVRSSRIGTP